MCNQSGFDEAYDLVEWDFVVGILRKIGAPMNFRRWIKTCNITPMFSVVNNDILVGKGKKGLRPGDLISPFFNKCSPNSTRRKEEEAQKKKRLTTKAKRTKEQRERIT